MNDSRHSESPCRFHRGSSSSSPLQLLGLSEAVMLGGHPGSPHLQPPHEGVLPPLPFSHGSPGPSGVRKPSQMATACGILTCHELAEHSVQTLSFHSARVQRQLQALPAHTGLSLPPVSCRMCSWRAYSPVGLCQHCAFSSRPLLPLRCLPCYIYSFLVRLSKPKDSCLLFSHGFGSGGKPLARCFPQEGAGAGLCLCFSPFGKFRHLSQLVSPPLV